MTCKSDLTPEEAELDARLRAEYQSSGRAAADQRRAAREALARMSPGQYVLERERILRNIEDGRREHERNAFVERLTSIGDVRSMDDRTYADLKRRLGL